MVHTQLYELRDILDVGPKVMCQLLEGSAFEAKVLEHGFFYPNGFCDIVCLIAVCRIGYWEEMIHHKGHSDIGHK